MAASKRSRRVRDCIQVNGAKLAYERIGNGLPVVFVPSFVSDRHQWALQVEPFVRHDYQVIRYDPRGFGRSGVGHAPYRASADLAGLLGALGVGRVAVVGSMDGAECALELAHDRPDLVGALILETPRLRYLLTRLLAEGRPMYLPPAVIRTRAELRAHRAAMRRVLAMRARSLAHLLPAFWWRQRRERYVPQYVTPPVSEHLDEVTAPTLIVLGELSDSLAMDQVELIRGALPRAKVVVIPRVGPLPGVPMEATEQFNSIAFTFLETHYRPDGLVHQETA